MSNAFYTNCIVSHFLSPADMDNIRESAPKFNSTQPEAIIEIQTGKIMQSYLFGKYPWIL